jgi:hypothetical protein
MATSDRRMDEAIDRAVKGMMQVEPAPGLSRRVLARLEPPVARRRFTMLVSPRGLAAVGVAATVAIGAVLLLRPAAPRVPESVTVTRQPPAVQPQQPPTVPAPSHAPSVPASAGRGPTRIEQPVRVDRRVEAANVPQYESETHIAPLTAIDPIGFAPVRSQSIGVSALSIDPIQVAPLRLEPLSSTPH